MDEITARWGMARESIYIVYTEHDAPDFQLSDRVLPSWQAGEDPPTSPFWEGEAQSRRGMTKGERRTALSALGID